MPGDEGHWLRGDADVPGHPRDRVFGLPVDSEQPGVLPWQPGDIFFTAAGLDEEVLIRKTTWNRAECERAPVRKFSAKQLPGLLR